MTPTYRKFCSKLIEVLEQYAPLHEKDAELIKQVRDCIQGKTLLEAVGMEKDLCNPLRRNGYTSVEQVLEAGPKDVMECRGLGPDRVRRIFTAISKYQEESASD